MEEILDENHLIKIRKEKLEELKNLLKLENITEHIQAKM